MAFQSLYRRYRPRRFAEVRGQADVVRALRNAVRDARVGHAYLFSGPRGTGKTSTARILAKALNCTDLREGEPCCACESCLAIEAGTSYDLQELDAASNNGVDAMRELIGRAALGSPGRTKVYILDEVHMLSSAASAALLKTLEEPPGHVVFVLATTDPQKVLPTIRSRTQHFEFHLLPADELAEHVQWVIADAGLDADAEAVDYVLRVGGGSARDTLSALDKVVAAGGAPDRGDQADGLIDAIADGDTAAALGAVGALVKRGRDPRVLGEGLLGDLRNVFLSRMGGDLSHLHDAEQGRVAGWAARFGDRQVTTALEVLGEALRDMRQAPDARIPLEVALLQLTKPDAGTSLDALVERVARLEAALAAGGATLPAAGGGAASERPGGAPGGAADLDAPPARPAGSRASDGARAAAQAAGERPSRTAASPAPKLPASGASAAAAPPPPSVPRQGRRAAEPAPTDPRRTPSAPADDAGASTDATPAASPADPAPDPVPAAAAPASPSGVPDRDTLRAAWDDKVLPSLKGLTKAVYSAGHFVESTDAAVFAVPGAVHRDRCEERRAEVEAALQQHFGRPVPLRLVADAEASAGPASAAADPSPRKPPAVAVADQIEAERVEVGDLDDLVDAPADDRTPIDRLTEAFPGADLIEEP